MLQTLHQQPLELNVRISFSLFAPCVIHLATFSSLPIKYFPGEYVFSCTQRFALKVPNRAAAINEKELWRQPGKKTFQTAFLSLISCFRLLASLSATKWLEELWAHWPLHSALDWSWTRSAPEKDVSKTNGQNTHATLSVKTSYSYASFGCEINRIKMKLWTLPKYFPTENKRTMFIFFYCIQCWSEKSIFGQFFPILPIYGRLINYKHLWRVRPRA